MFIRDISDCKPFTAGDMSLLRELFNPSTDQVDISYSLAHATLAPGQTTLSHKLSASEVYYILKGNGLMRIGRESRPLKAGQAVYIPPGMPQMITNSAADTLEFLCIVAPSWRPEYEQVLQ